MTQSMLSTGRCRDLFGGELGIRAGATRGTRAPSSSIDSSGATFFTGGEEHAADPSFGNYDLGGSVDGQRQPITSASKARSAAPLGITHRICSSPAVTSNLKTPNLLNYSGNVVVSGAERRRPVVPCRRPAASAG